MFIFVAIDAKGIFNPESSFFACWYMTRRTFHFSVWRCERKAGLRMIRRRECRGRPPFYRVAALAFAAVCALRELSPVWIRLVAIGAAIVLDRGFEVPRHVTLFARNLEVLSQERE
jgi:hypothetical protein